MQYKDRGLLQTKRAVYATVLLTLMGLKNIHLDVRHWNIIIYHGS